MQRENRQRDTRHPKPLRWVSPREGPAPSVSNYTCEYFAALRLLRIPFIIISTDKVTHTHTHTPRPHSYLFNQPLRRANYGNQGSIFVWCNILVGWAHVFTNGMSFCGFGGCDSPNIHSGVIRPFIFCNPERTILYAPRSISDFFCEWGQDVVQFCPPILGDQICWNKRAPIAAYRFTVQHIPKECVRLGYT